MEWAVIPAAVALDLVAGDPPRFPHPVRWMGRAIVWMEPRMRRSVPSPVAAGALMTILLTAVAGGAVFLLLAALRPAAPGAAVLVEILLLYTCLSARSLGSEAMRVHQALVSGRVSKARRRLAGIVGRDVRGLSEERISMASVETVAENLVDGFVSPLFFYLLGGVPLAMAFKMVSTLDSMIGYRNQRYLLFGRAAARLDDAANFLPARLSVLLIALAARLLAGRGRASLETARREGRHHASPNAGLPEAAFAGALGVRLGGPNIYHGRRVEKPYIGTGFPPPGTGHIARAVALMMVTALLWAAVAGLLGGLPLP